MVELFIFFIAFVVFAFALTLRIFLFIFSRRKEVVCKECEYTGRVRKKLKGSIFIEVLLWLLIIAPGVVYTVWRLLNRTFFCPICGGSQMIPIHSPKGKQILLQRTASDGTELV